MARRLFQYTATRGRAGPLADGITYVVYSDAAGVVFADIAASSGGASIVGSAVTTADIAGLGLAALVFWGPPDGTTNLYLRCPSDPTLGVQEVTADADARLDDLEGGSAHATDTTNVHGILDTSQLAIKSSPNIFSSTNRFTAGEPWWDARAFGTDIPSIQLAIDLANAAGGGIVRVHGHFTGNAATLILRDNVHLQGTGPASSTISFPELGAGVNAIQEAPTAVGSATSAPMISNLGVVGPSSPAFTLGVAPALMDGIEVSTRWTLEGVHVGGFRSGLKIIRDHQVFNRCKSYNNYYNVYFSESPISKGNQWFLWCDFSGATFASICCTSGNNLIDGCTFIGGHGGFAPYVFYHEAGPPVSLLGLISISELIGFSMEAVGNAAFLDETTGTGSGADSIFGTHISNPGFSWQPGYKIAARPADYALDIRSMSHVEIFGGTYPFTAGAAGTYRVTGSSDVTIRQHGVPTFSGPADGIRLELENGIKAQVRIATATITAKDLLEGGQSEVARYGTTDRGSFAGVALNDATAGTNVAAAHAGMVEVVANAAVSTGGVNLVPDEANLVRVKPAPSTGANGYQFGSATAVPNKHPIVGYSNRDIAAAASGNMWLGEAPNRTYVAPGAVTSLPAASATYRGQMLRVEGGSGVADGLFVCMKDAANAYSWVAVP